MINLQALPAELLLEIASHVLPDDIESFTAISKHVRQVLQPVIKKHQALKQRYGQVSCGCKNGEYPNMFTLISKSILEPWPRLYIKSLAILDENLWMSDSDTIHSEKMHPLVRQHINREMDEAWPCDIYIDLCFLPMALQLLPGLRTLEIISSADHLMCVAETMLRKSVNSLVFTSLERLKIRIAGPSIEQGLCLHTLGLLARLPSLRVLSVKGTMDTGECCYAPKTFKDMSSGVRELTLIDSTVGIEAMTDFLRHFPQLKSLRWEDSKTKSMPYSELSDAV